MITPFYKKILSRISPSKTSASMYTKDILKGELFEIGDFTYGNPLVLAYGEEKKLKIGKYCSIAEGVKIFLGGNHRTDWITTYPFSAFNGTFPEAKNIVGHPSSRGDVIIGNDVWIGHSSTIMSGLNIADGAVIAACSVITKNIGPYEVWGGNPARLIKKRFTDDEIQSLLSIKWWNWEVEKVKLNVQLLCSGSVAAIEIASKN